jgi:hypothetical protein
MEGVKTFLSSQAADFFDTVIQKLIRMLRSSVSTYVFFFLFTRIIFSFLIACFFNSSQEFAFRIALV